ncbi:MAG: hypothetical protein EOP61_26710 [Sphingomonadales bacterium]|nr:MAG: hypothetical protein EOP61_26710 [Sphingomonadales bacterium]
MPHPLFQGSFGLADTLRQRDPAAAIEQDRLMDEELACSGWAEWLQTRPQPSAVRNILVVLTAYPDAEETLQPLAAAMRSRHDVCVHIDARPDVPRFAKVNEVVRSRGATMDWLVISDDDVAVRPNFLGRFITAAETAGLVIAQPAHRIHSYATYAVTQRKPRSIVRSTSFVEIGPLVAIHRSVFWKMLPFPENRFGWGVDFLWADWARSNNWRIGMVDETPIEHLRPPNSTYSRADSLAEAQELLALHAPDIGRDQMRGDGKIVIGW